MVDALYGSDPDGGPDDADSVVNTLMFHLRRDLVGWDIIKLRHGMPYSLVRAEEQRLAA